MALSLMTLLHVIKKQSPGNFIMHNIYTLNKFLKDELSARETYRQAVAKLREDAGLGEAKSLMPIYKNDIDAVFSQALMRRLGENPCGDS
jgi:hypothetical protein